jgi:hypothetical protein
MKMISNNLNITNKYKMKNNDFVININDDIVDCVDIDIEKENSVIKNEKIICINWIDAIKKNNIEIFSILNKNKIPYPCNIMIEGYKTKNWNIILWLSKNNQQTTWPQHLFSLDIDYIIKYTNPITFLNYIKYDYKLINNILSRPIKNNIINDDKMFLLTCEIVYTYLSSINEAIKKNECSLEIKKWFLCIFSSLTNNFSYHSFLDFNMIKQNEISHLIEELKFNHY